MCEILRLMIGVVAEGVEVPVRQEEVESVESVGLDVR